MTNQINSTNGICHPHPDKNLIAPPLAAVDPVLRWPEVAKLVPISRSHAHFLATQGQFPRPIKLGARASGWLQSEIRQWLADRVAESRADDVDTEAV